MENNLQNHENRIQSQRHISEIQVKDQRNTVGNRDNGGYAQTRFGIERKPQGQDKQPGSIESRAVPNIFFIIIFLLHYYFRWFSRFLSNAKRQKAEDPMDICQKERKNR